MDTATIQWIISIVLCIVPWVFPNLPWYWKAIITLIVFLISLTVSWFRLNHTLKESKRAQLELSGKHRALAEQFDQKNLVLRRYQYLTATLERFLQIALLNEDSAKIHLIYRAYLEAKRELIDGGNSDEQ